MIVTFFGHAQILQREEIEKWLYVVTENLIEQGAITFYLGGYQNTFVSERKSHLVRRWSIQAISLLLA